MVGGHFVIMRSRRLKISGGSEASYHCMTRTVNGERLFEGREKELSAALRSVTKKVVRDRVLTSCRMARLARASHYARREAHERWAAPATSHTLRLRVPH